MSGISTSASDIVGAPLFVRLVDAAQAWLPEPRHDDVFRQVKVLVALSLGLVLITLAVLLLLDLPAAASIPHAAMIVLTFSGGVVSFFTLAEHLQASTRLNLSRVFATIGKGGSVATAVLSGAISLIGATFFAAAGNEAFAATIGAQELERNEFWLGGVLFMYFSAVAICSTVFLGSPRVNGSLVALTGALTPMYAALISAIIFAVGAAVGVSNLGAPAISVVVAVAVSGIGSFGRLLLATRRAIAVSRTRLVEALDHLTIAINANDLETVRSEGLAFSRMSAERHTFGIRIVPPAVRRTFDGLLSHVSDVHLPSARTFETFAYGRFRTLTVEDAKLVLQEGCTTLRFHLIET